MQDINFVNRITPTDLEVSFIETLIFYTCLDSYGEVTDSEGFLYQKTRDGAKFIHDVVALLWKIADKDEDFMKRVEEYEHLLKQATKGKNEALTVFHDRRVNNFRTVNQQAKGGDAHKSRLHS